MNLNEKILNTLFLNISEGVIIADAENKISMVTPKIFELLYISTHAQIKNETDLISIIRNLAEKPGQTINVKESITAFPHKSTTNVIELKNRVFIDLSSFPILVNKKFTGRIWLITDVTESITSAKKIENYINELKLNEERINRKAFDLFQINNQLQKSEEKLKLLNADKDKFFSIIAHDLKSPFTAFLGTTSMLSEDYDEFSNSERKELLNSINTTAKNIYGLLDNLLEWAQIQTGKLEFKLTEINISELLSSIIELLGPLAESKNIQIKNNINNFTEITCDPNMFSTVIRNLLSNAIKFTNQNGTIDFSDEFVGTEYLFILTDNGIGMSQDEINEILNNDNHSTRLGTNKEKGTGLGLKLTKELIAKHKGEMQIESISGKGTTIKIKIPQ